VDDIEGINRPAAVCPNCGAEYRSGFDTCADCGVALVPVGEVADGLADDGVEPGTIEIIERAPSADDAPLSATDPDGEESMDLFFAEEHPSRVVLVRLDRYDATDVATRLEKSGIGARTTPPDADDVSGVIVHDTRLPEAQAIIAEMGFAPWDELEDEDEDELGEDASDVGSESVDDAWADATRRLWGEDTEPSEDVPVAEASAFVPVTREPIVTARANAERLADAGIDVRILVDRYPGDDATTAEVCVPGDRVEDAREILRIER
jgi:hypothetical protein